MKLKAVLYFLPLLTACAAGREGWLRVGERHLYDIMPAHDPEAINGFSEVTVFNDYIDNSVWVSKESGCVQMKQETAQTYSGTGALRLTWDKVSGGCTWIGMGFGWNNWAPKDMNGVLDSAALQFQVKSVKGSFSNLPVAFGLEDYAGVQAWYGFNSTLASGTFNDSNWTAVTIPMNLFPISARDVDPGKIKQLIIQLEGDGAIYLDEIRIIRNP
ncbi:MAG: hypothetical protein KJS92_01450 [Bacteroidetes bacterium]|nr:hypothetical protein [Bacteroidota bacterium]